MAEVQGIEQRIGPVNLTVPAFCENLRVLRLVASSLAASLGLDVDQLDDLRIAVDELCSLLIEDAPPRARLGLTVRNEGAHLLVDGSLVGEAPVPEIDPVSQLILEGLDVDWSTDSSSPSFCLVIPSRHRRDVP